MLAAFNYPIENWLDFFMFAMFADRDGKSQLLSLSESAFDPLSRTTRFMLTEEAFHMFVGESSVSRIIQRTCELMREQTGLSEDVRQVGGIDLPLLQKSLNYWVSASLDLHGSEVSSNAAFYFSNGLKGRAHEERHDDHMALEGSYTVESCEDDRLVRQVVPVRQAMNEVLRDWYYADCARGVERWNRVIAASGLSDRLTHAGSEVQSPYRLLSNRHFDVHGAPLSTEAWEARKYEWLPSPADKAYLSNLMTIAVHDADTFANYIAPPSRGVHRQPVNFSYVRTEG